MIINDGKLKEHKFSKYPDDCLSAFIRIYKHNSSSLESLARREPAIELSQLNADVFKEHQLLDSQDSILNIAAKMSVGCESDVHQMLKLWHLAAIEGVRPENISPSDQIILTIYNYYEMSPNQ